MIECELKRRIWILGLPFNYNRFSSLTSAQTKVQLTCKGFLCEELYCIFHPYACTLNESSKIMMIACRYRLNASYLLRDLYSLLYLHNYSRKYSCIKFWNQGARSELKLWEQLQNGILWKLLWLSEGERKSFAFEYLQQKFLIFCLGKPSKTCCKWFQKIQVFSVFLKQFLFL